MCARGSRLSVVDGEMGKWFCAAAGLPVNGRSDNGVAQRPRRLQGQRSPRQPAGRVDPSAPAYSTDDEPEKLVNVFVVVTVLVTGSKVKPT